MLEELLPHPEGPAARLAEAMRYAVFSGGKRLRPVLAHPERYAPIWKDRTLLDPLLDGGTVLLLDVAALDGKYGRRPEQTALDLLEDGYYSAACSDAHRPEDVSSVVRGIKRLTEVVGLEEAEFLLGEGPRQILEGRVEA